MVKEGFDSIAEFLIGDVGVVERWEEALHWMQKDGGFGTLVTLEGDILQSSGVISGGSRDQGLGLLERRREIRDLEKKVKELEEECRKTCDEEERLQKEITSNEVPLEERKKEIQ